MCLIVYNTIRVLNNLEVLLSTTIHPYNILKKFIKKLECKIEFHLLSVKLNS
jgi:hypothetical protein